jgi:putative hydrolase of the HAD superfamily
MQNLTHVFLDLDHTLWDFDKNSYLTLQVLYEELDLTAKTDIYFEVFFDMYKKINAELWKAYNTHSISQSELRNTRFIRVFEALNREISSQINDILAFEYVHRCTRTGHLIEGAEELLQHLQGNYEYHIITNGFNDSQWAKVEHSKLIQYIKPEQLTTSEQAGAHKPNKRIFEHVCNGYNVSPQQCIMIGDNLDTDILGARQAGITSVWFAPHETEKHTLPDIQITHLNQLTAFLK